MYLKPISWKPLGQDSVNVRPDVVGDARGSLVLPFARVIRAKLEGAPILQEVSLSEFDAKMKSISAEALKLRDSSASFWGVLLLVFALLDVFGNAYGRPTVSGLLARLVLQETAGDSRAILAVWALQLVTYSVGFMFLRASAWRFWIRRALINALPVYLGGNEGADHTRNLLNFAGLLLFGVGALCACAAVPGSSFVAMISAACLGLLTFPVAKAILPIMIVDDRLSIWAAIAGGVFGWLVAFIAGTEADLSYHADLLLRQMTAFQADQFLLGALGIFAIATVLLGSWHQRVVFHVQMNPRTGREHGSHDSTPSCIQANSLLGLPAPTTYVSFDGSEAYLVLTRKPLEDTYLIRKPLEKVSLNEFEVSVITLASVSELELSYPTTNGASTTVAIGIAWPQATSLAKSFKGERISQEVVEWFEGMILRNGGFLKRLEERIPGLIELPRARLLDRLAELTLQYDRLTTDLERKRVVPHILTEDWRINRLLTLTEGFVRFWEGLEVVRREADLIRSESTREKIVSRWHAEFGSELERELFRSYETALSVEHRSEAAVLLRPVADAVSHSISTNVALDAEVNQLLKRPEAFEQRFQVANGQLADEITACLADQEKVALRRDDEAAAHGRDLQRDVLKAIQVAVQTSARAARESVEWARDILKQNSSGLAADFRGGLTPPRPADTGHAVASREIHERPSDGPTRAEDPLTGESGSKRTTRRQHINFDEADLDD